MTNKRRLTIGITCLNDRPCPVGGVSDADVEEPTRDQHPPPFDSASGEASYRAPRFGQSQAYVHAVARAGAASVLIPQLTDKTLLRTIYDLVDGLLLSGGEDVDPAHYGEPRHEKCGLVSPDRDEVELTLTRWAMDDGKPLLAICRGIQVLNVALGGSLYQDIRAQVREADKHDWHPGYPRNRLSPTIIVAPQTHLAHILGAPSEERALRGGSGQASPDAVFAQRESSPCPSYWVNSLHHQAIKDVAPGLTVAARAPDKIVEAVEAEGHPFAIGVQWHPEELAAISMDVRAQRIFDALVEACQR